MKEKEKIYKHWKEWLDEDGFVPVEVQEERLNYLSKNIVNLSHPSILWIVLTIKSLFLI